MAWALDAGLRPTEKQWAMLEDVRSSGEFCCTFLEYHRGSGWRVVVIPEDNVHTPHTLHPASHPTAGKAIAAAFRAWKRDQRAEPKSDHDESRSSVPDQAEWALFWEMSRSPGLSGVRLNSDYSYGWEVDIRPEHAGEDDWRVLQPTFDDQAGVAIRAGHELWKTGSTGRGSDTIDG